MSKVALLWPLKSCFRKKSVSTQAYSCSVPFSTYLQTSQISKHGGRQQCVSSSQAELPFICLIAAAILAETRTGSSQAERRQ